MRDATRGGVATVLNELARDAELAVTIREEAVPVDDVVRGACELLGLDPLQVANEGQFVAIVAADRADAALAALRSTPGGERACLLGEDRRGRWPARAGQGGLRRRARRRHADRRSAAADLLTPRKPTMTARIRS